MIWAYLVSVWLRFVSLFSRASKKPRRKAVWTPAMREAAANRMRARMLAFHASKRNGNGSAATASESH